MADPTKPTDGAGPTHIHIEKARPVNWLAWLALLLGLLALAYFLLGRRHDTATTSNSTTTTTTMPGPATGAAAGPTVAATTTATVGALGAYLAGSEATPRTFAFDTMHSRRRRGALTAPDKATVDGVAGVLGQYPKASVKIVGYADARGSAGANQKLGLARADAIKAALVAKASTAVALPPAAAATPTRSTRTPPPPGRRRTADRARRRQSLIVPPTPPATHEG